MLFVAFFLGVLCGISVPRLRALCQNGFAMLGEDEKYLLAAARAANGRLLLKQDVGTSGNPILLLKEFPNPRHLEAKGLVDKLVARRFIQPDASGHSGRYMLTPKGWEGSQQLPEFPLQLVRPGSSWFNSISRKPGRRLHR